MGEEVAASSLARPGLWCARKGPPTTWGAAGAPCCCEGIGAAQRNSWGELGQSRIQQSWELLLPLWRCQQGRR